MNFKAWRERIQGPIRDLYERLSPSQRVSLAVLCVVGLNKLTVENSFIDYFKSSTENCLFLETSVLTKFINGKYSPSTMSSNF